MVLFGLAALAGKQATRTASLGDEESVAVAETARAGALETLSHAVALVPPSSGAKPCGSGDCGGGRGTVGNWAQQTLAPLLRECAGKLHQEEEDVGDEGEEAVEESVVALGRPATARKLSASERKMPEVELRAHELSAALGVADALLHAARKPVDGRAGPLADLLLETPLAAGLLARARLVSALVPVADSAVSAEFSDEGQHYQKAGQGESDGPTSLKADSDAAASAVTADAALRIVREASALCPEGVWMGLRAELLPALAAGSSGGGSSAAGAVRAALVLREVVDGMGTRVVPFAARLLPVALRGMTDANEQVRWSGVCWRVSVCMSAFGMPST